MYYGYYDPTYILILVGAVISLIASARVKSAFQKYSHTGAMNGLTGAQVAQRLLAARGIYDVQVAPVAGSLTDHYDPSTRTVNLSEPVYGSSSLSAIAVAAHECGHAMQHAEGYAPLAFRSSLVPVANFGGTLSWPLVLVGLFLGGNISSILIHAGIILFCTVLLFQIVTLPVEFNASSRAMAQLEGNGLLASSELSGAKTVLRAAALTYVASVAASLLQLLRLLAIANRRRR